MKGNISNYLDVIVVGAGHAGLSISYYLKQLGLSHLVFERGKVGDSWSNQRWDSFRLNTPNRVNLLPGLENKFQDGDGYCSASDFVNLLDSYRATFNLPVIENCEVVAIKKKSGSQEFSVQVIENNLDKIYTCRKVVVASGGQNKPYIPFFSSEVNPQITQLHAAGYRNESLLPPGAVFVVGSAQSGVQIAEDLLLAGRHVFLSTSKVGRACRRYRGRDIVDWLLLTGYFDVRTSEIPLQQIRQERQPQISGTGIRGHTLSLQLLAKMGAVILGKAENADTENIYLQTNAAENIRFADAVSAKIKNMVDGYIKNLNLDAEPSEEDIPDLPDDAAVSSSSLSTVNFRENNIRSIIWASGFTGEYNYLKLPALDNSGRLLHNEGISEIEGLYFLGIPWLRKRKSAIICGIAEDAEFIAERVRLSRSA
jgi:putative flavoprotein involved in K+ transport